jgi:hypothetical protein
MQKDKKSLVETHPEIAQQWHPTLNGDLTPRDVTPGSDKKVWWKCDKGDDHEWISQPNSRTGQKQNCPICSNKKIVNSNCLATTHPELAKQWHPTKNGHLNPHNTGSGSNKKVWWKCEKGDDHEWYVKPTDRTGYSTGCPYCSNKKAAISNCLTTSHPELAKQWHPTKNGKLTPNKILGGSAKKVWWKCPNGEDHIYFSSVVKRTREGRGCPYCAGRKVCLTNSLFLTHPKLAKQWHPTKNGKLTPQDVYAGSFKKVWWKCDKGDDHEYEMLLSDRKRGYNCPICRGLKVVGSTSLEYTNPELLKQWDYTRNKIKPSEISVNSNVKVWWKCDKANDHVWMISPNSRYTQKSECPYCKSRKVTKSNCLATTHPKIAKQWHPEKNGDLTPNLIGAFYSKRVWWKCDKGDDHEWYVKPTDRTGYSTGCPFCTLTPQSKQELTITFELMKFFKNIDPKGFKTRLDGRLRAIDIYIPKLNLCVEFDGSYWHKNKRELDKIKSEMLFEEGFKLIRVRVEPLKKIYDTDVISKQPYNGKQVTNDILSMILSIFELDAKLVSKIKEYQSKEGLQNEKGLERHIDKILTEKAEKKVC